MRTSIIYPLEIALALLISLSGKAQETRKYNVMNFTGIESSIAGKIMVQTSDSYSVEITTTDKRFLDAIKVKVDDDNVLCIRNTERNYNTNKTIETVIRISIPLLLSIEQNGVGNIVFENEINAESLSIEVSGVSNIEFAEGGRIRNIEIESNGVGTIDAHNVKSVNSSVEISGVGNVMINASKKVKGELSGVGSLTIYGDALIDIKKTGIGRVIRK